MFVACGIWCLADVSSVSPSSEQTSGEAMTKIPVCSDEGLTLETSAKHYPTGDKHTISTLLIKPIFSVLAHAEKQFFSKLVFQKVISRGAVEISLSHVFTLRLTLLLS